MGWMETYRGVVNPWECDMVEHFTVAYYFERFADATLAIMESIGQGPSVLRDERHTCASVDCHVRYLRELKAGDILHIDSAVIGVSDKLIRLGHKVFDSADGELVTTMEQTTLHFDADRRKATPLPDAVRARAEAALVDWDGPEREERNNPQGDNGFIGAVRDTVRPWEIDVLGHMGFQFYVHRFSAAMAQALAAAGITPAFMRDRRRGISTFEFQLSFHGELQAGDLIEIRSAIVQVGRTSLRMLHRLYDARSGNLSAQLSQFGVLLDLDARRPTELPDSVRAKLIAA